LISASDFGGVWFWNRYPGARVDSETPFYQLNIPEVYNTWSFKKRFPDHVELRAYMAHIDKTLNLRRDTSFDSKVNGCTWDEDEAKWTVKTEAGVTARAQFLILATGLLHKTYLPSWPGQEKYQGHIYHSVEWPENTDVTGKRVAVIGAGSTSVQIVQELGKTASHLTLLMRRPPYCLPMHQRTWTREQQDEWRSNYPALFAASRNSAVGIPSKRHELRVQDVDPAKREQYYEEMWKAGGHQFLLRNYNNIMLDKDANKAVYSFWKNKVQQRLTDPKKQALMTPDEMPYFFSTKRTPLEHDFYEILNQDNVDIVDINAHPIDRFTERGVHLGGEERERAFDYIICATGFDSYTGSMTTMGLKNKHGVDVKDMWRDGVRTYLGMTMSTFPNTFMVYSPHAPNALANAPTIIGMSVLFPPYHF
jgi:cation diffusion facilitator CzcD-associated flavoprotein CzcO